MPLAGTQLTHAEAAKYLYDAGWHDAVKLSEMVATGHAESGLWTEAYHVNNNGTTDWGFLQLNDGGKTGTELENFKAMAFDPAKASAYARKLYSVRGFQPWVAYTTGAYKQYMPQATRGIMNMVRIMFNIPIY